MRIAILSCFYPYRGGISQFNASLLNELRKEHTVKAFNFKRQYPDFLFPGKTQFVDKKDNAVPVESEALLDTANPFSYITTAKKIREWKPDLLIMRYWMSWFAPSQGWVARHMDKNCRVISILDNVVPHEKRFFDKPLTSYYLKGNDAFVTLCDAVRDDLLTLKKDARYIVSPHPLYSHFGEKKSRAEAAAHLGIDPRKKTLLFFGLIREYKGLDILLEAFSQLDASYQLIVAGEPYGSFEKYQKLIDNSPLRAHIKFFDGYIPDGEVPYFFCASDVCVLPYRSATQSGISSVSYHFEVPLITTSVGGLKETVGERGTGIVTDEVSSEAIREAILHYFSSPEIKNNLIEGIKAEKQRLSWSNFCSNLLKLYSQFL